MYFSLDLILNVEKLFHFLHNLVHFEDGGCMGYIKVIKKIFVMIDINLRCVFKHFDNSPTLFLKDFRRIVCVTV